MITTNHSEPTTLKCSRCGKIWSPKPFHYHLAPMCNKCHTFQTLCEDCEKKGCICCGKELSIMIF